MPLHISQRQTVALDTIARSNVITSECAAQGASDASTFIADQLPVLDPLNRPNPNQPPFEITVINSDSFAAARAVMNGDPQARGKTAVLNLASDEVRAGGWEASLWTTQVSHPLSLRVPYFAKFICLSPPL